MASFYKVCSQTDDMPTLYVGDPGQGSNSETLFSRRMYINYTTGGSYSDHLTGNSQFPQNFCDLSNPTTILSQDSSLQPSKPAASNGPIPSNLASMGFGENSYGVWHDRRNEQFLQTFNGQVDKSENGLMHHFGTEGLPMAIQSQFGILQCDSLKPDVSTVQGQGLSLCLGPQIPPTLQASSCHYNQDANTDIPSLVSHKSSPAGEGSCIEDISLDRQLEKFGILPHSSGNCVAKGGMSSSNLQHPAGIKQIHQDSLPYGFSGQSGAISNSKYLKAALQLLDEVVNVQEALKKNSEKHQRLSVTVMHSPSKQADVESIQGALSSSDEIRTDPQDSTPCSTIELSSTEKQDLQTKMMKLVALLDEVDGRYRQYHHQLQTVVSSFEVIAGCGSAKPYTALALQTISQHFRCLRDAVNSQIKVTKKCLGEQDDPSGNMIAISRLRFVDQQLKQQRAYPQYGMIQVHAWRPQRGLPENSVSILRAWLFEHFLHPYPKDSDKILLARRTGLTRNQVSNWFINARVRLWKPMVEEMYREEIGDVEMDSNSSSDNATKSRDETKAYEDREDLQCAKTTTEKFQTSQHSDSKKSDNISDNEIAPNLEELNYENLKSSNNGDCSLLQDAVQPESNGRFMAIPMPELERFDNGGVSLTLGLQNCDGAIAISGGNRNLFTIKGDADSYTAYSEQADATEYDCLNLGIQRQRFGSLHLLHDFAT